MDLHLEGKVIIITGGFKGIGKGITLQLAQEGAIPVVINRPDSALDEFKKDIEQYTTTYDVHLLDLNDTDKIAGVVEATYKKYGHIDGIVNNAGKNDNKDLETTTWREFEESLHGNLTHYYELVHAAVPYLKEKPRIHREHLVQDRAYRPRQDQRLCGRQGRDPGPDP